MARYLGGAALVLLGVVAVDAAITSVERKKARAIQGADGATDYKPLFPRMRLGFLDATQAMQSAVLLRAPPLTGERLHATERGLERALEEEGHGDATRAADIRRLLALLAARDGRFDEALRRYDEVAREDPADPRPHVLASILCCLSDQPDEETRRWEPGCRLLSKDSVDQLRPLVQELVVAAALGGAPCGIGEGEDMAESTQGVMLCAAERADAWLATALREDEMPGEDAAVPGVARVLARENQLLEDKDAV